MNQWLRDTNHVSNGHATPGPTPDLPMSFPQQPQTINPAQFQNQSFLNGAARTGSPAFHQPMYQTNSVIPSKRSREDSLGTSPRQSNTLPPGSRSQTPGQPQFAGFNPQTNGAPTFTSAPNQFQHLQTSNNATPSPTMQQMGFPQGNPAAQRVSTASPSPFSPQHNLTNASPAPSDRGSRVGTPHDAPQNFMQSSGGPGFNPQQFAQGMPGQMNMSQMMAGGQMQNINPAHRYQMQLQLQAQQMARQQAQMRNQNGIPNGMTGHMGMPANAHEQQSAAQMKLNSTPQDFFRALQQFSAAKGRPIDMTPQICGRPVEALRVYQAIFKGGGSKQISKHNQWGMVAQHLQFIPQQIPQAAMELQQWWMTNVGAFEQMWIVQQQKQRQALHNQMQNQMQNQMSPSRDVQQQNNMNNHQRMPSDTSKLNGQPIHHDMQQTNGFTPKDQNESLPTHKRTNTQSGLSRQLDPNEVANLQSQTSSEASVKRPSSAVKVEPETESTMPVQKPIEDPFVPEVMPPSRNHGPVNVEEAFNIGQLMVESKPVVPNIRELGIIDIHALTMAIRSGMHGEMRNALDTLITLSSETSLQIQLDLCDDLMEALVDCAQVEVDFLAEHASEVTDEISLSSYEELVRGCQTEAKLIQPIPEFGSLDYDLDRAVDRLICITTLIRNFSFYEPNFITLGQPEVVQLVTRVIQYIGTKDMPLRTSRNTLDFMKDVIIYLSNLSSHLHLPGKQEALCLLHFLLAFAPGPSPISSNSEKVVFASYNPAIHKYLPPAVDSLAKLLARDEPNRVYFKAIFAANGRAAVPYELLTRAFGLVVAPIPQGSAQLRVQLETRKPFLLQGMLAAEILASLAPGSENPLARSWLQSEDCFAGNLLKVASFLSTQASSANNARQQQNNRNPAQRGHLQDDDPLAHGSIVNRAMAVLRILVNKSRTLDSDGNANATDVPSSALMKKETLLGAMVQKDIEPTMLRLFCGYAGLED